MSEAPRGNACLAEAWAAIGEGDVPRALRHVAEAYGHIGRWCDGSQRLPIGWPEADRVIADAANIVRATRPPPARGGENDAVLFSRWTNFGGHRFAAGDTLRASPAPNKFAFVIHPGRAGASAEQMADKLGIPPDCVEIAPAGARDRPWEWLPERLAARGCARLFVVHETYRPGVLVAAIASSCAGIYLLHHIDSKPCSGLYLPGITVVELTPFCYHYSRLHLGIHPIYLPLISEPPPGERPSFMADGELRTATCGREEKFEADKGFPYAAIVAERLRRFAGRHVHIGHLSEGAREMIGAALREAGVEPGRFEYLSRIPNLPAALWANRVDLYLASFPHGGARTIIDVMASATPAIVYVRGPIERLGNTSLRAPGTAEWSRPEELWEILGSIDPAWLAERSRLASEHFGQYHSRATLASALASPRIVGVTPPPPPDDAMMPSPQNAICHLLADVAWLRKSEREMRARLVAIEAAVSRGIRWPRWLRPWRRE